MFGQQKQQGEGIPQELNVYTMYVHVYIYVICMDTCIYVDAYIYIYLCIADICLL